jgi:hypothetical protein
MGRLKVAEKGGSKRDVSEERLAYNEKSEVVNSKSNHLAPLRPNYTDLQYLRPVSLYKHITLSILNFNHGGLLNCLPRPKFLS